MQGQEDKAPLSAPPLPLRPLAHAHSHARAPAPPRRPPRASVCLLGPHLPFSPFLRPRQLRSPAAQPASLRPAPMATEVTAGQGCSCPWPGSLPVSAASTHLRFAQDLAMATQASQGPYGLILAPLAFAARIPDETKQAGRSPSHTGEKGLGSRVHPACPFQSPATGLCGLHRTGGTPT